MLQTCQIFCHDLADIGNVDIFRESLTIALACRKGLRKQTDGLIPGGGYICNNNHRKKALMWLQILKRPKAIE
jgi:hypothetical protein